MKLFSDKLIRDPNFPYDISDAQWEAWCHRLAKSRSVGDSISGIASYLALEWPYTRRQEKIGDYVGYSLADVVKIKGLGRKRIRTLIACIAYAASRQSERRIRSLPDRGNKNVDGKANGEQPCFLGKSLLNLSTLSDEEKELIWASFEGTKIIDSEIPVSDWDRLQNYGIYPDDTLETFLTLSIDYLYEIWPDNNFNKIVEMIRDLMKNFLRRQVSFNDAEIYDNSLLFSGTQFSALTGLPLLSSFVPEDMVNKLFDYGITKWEQVIQLSECTIVRQHGFNTKSVSLLILLRDIRPVANEIIAKLMPVINHIGHGASFESILTPWILKRTKKQRDAEIVIKRMGWGMEAPQTFDEIAQAYHLTRARVQQVIAKFLTSANKMRFANDCYPLWILIDSYLHSSSGISSLKELAVNLQAYFNLEHRPLFAGLMSLLHLVPARILRIDVLNEELGLICSQRFICKECIVASDLLVRLASEAEEILIYDVLNELNSHCATHCSKKHRGFIRFGESFVDYLVTNDQHVREIVRKKEDKLYHIDRWNMLYGRLINLAEAILRTAGKAMHFTEIYDEIKKIRPDVNDLLDRNVHAALDRSHNVYLWDRGTFIHKDYVSLPLQLLGEIERWIITELKSLLPYMSVNRAYRNFQSSCSNRGIPTETALYSCLREYSHRKLLFPQYPQIHFAKPETKKIPNSIIFDEFLKDAGGLVTYNDIKDYFMNGVGLKEFQLQQLISDNPNILKLSSRNYLHIANCDFDMKKSQQHFEELIVYSLKFASQRGHVSVEKIFKDKQVDCKRIGIHSPEMLYSILRLFGSGKFLLPRYPQIRLSGDDEVVKAGVSRDIIEYILGKNDFCTISELENNFGKLGYGQQSIWNIRYRDGIYNYLRGAIIHRETIKWSDEKQRQLESIAMKLYNDFYRAGQYYGLIEEILELDSLPPLNYEINYTQLLLADLLVGNNNFIILGNARNAYVPSFNAYNIQSLEDLVSLLLKSKYEGAASLQDFEGFLVDSGIIQKRLTATMLGDCTNVIITGSEIIVKDLINHA
jgi:hypothetical protein